MNDLRCKKCNKLLCRYQECQELEIKCPRCGIVNYLVNNAVTIKAKTPKEERSIISVRTDMSVG